MKSARDVARARCGGRFAANIVMPVSAHPAFDKAALLMDLEVRRLPVGPDLRADPAAMEAACDADTILLVGSAPSFPYGVVDDIPALGEVAARRGVPLHVDACVGGWIANFARDLGEDFPPFDFAVPAVASLSADLHKFGFCPKPASTVFFRDTTRSAAAGFDMDVWPNGRFATNTFVGTRPGGAVAAAWAVLNFLGRDGYRDITRRLLEMRRAYEAGVAAIDGLAVLGRPHLSILAVRSTDPALDINKVADLAAIDVRTDSVSVGATVRGKNPRMFCVPIKKPFPDHPPEPTAISDWILFQPVPRGSREESKKTINLSF